MKEITKFYNHLGEESCGFVLPEGIVSVKNRSKKPYDEFEMSEKDIIKFEDKAIGTWHTHPKSNCNLSVADYLCFLAFPEWAHYIYDGDHLAKYTVRGDVVILNERVAL